MIGETKTVVLPDGTYRVIEVPALSENFAASFDELNYDVGGTEQEPLTWQQVERADMLGLQSTLENPPFTPSDLELHGLADGKEYLWVRIY